MDSEKQPEGFEGAGGGRLGGTKWWVLGRARITWSTGCGAKTMDTVTLKRNFFKKPKCESKHYKTSSCNIGEYLQTLGQAVSS